MPFGGVLFLTPPGRDRAYSGIETGRNPLERSHEEHEDVAGDGGGGRDGGEPVGPRAGPDDGRRGGGQRAGPPDQGPRESLRHRVLLPLASRAGLRLLRWRAAGLVRREPVRDRRLLPPAPGGWLLALLDERLRLRSDAAERDGRLF